MAGPRTILLSRPDALGDAVVTLSTAGWIKRRYPDARIVVLARAYARAVWDHSAHADAVLTLEELQAGDAVARLRALNADAAVHVFPHRAVAGWAREARIPMRIGTSHRWWHWITCNERVGFSRKRSLLHEAELNIKLLGPLGIAMPRDADALVPYIGLNAPAPDPLVSELLVHGKRTLVVHPLQGSGVGWGLANHAALMKAVDPAVWHVVVTGTAAEAERYRGHLPLALAHVTDAGGRLSLEQLMMLIGRSDALVAASTGPLHLAAALGRRAIGLYSMRRPIFPARWRPLGTDAHALVHDADCERCAAGKPCDCITRIPLERVLELLRP
jgi:ADP-heptose:LPS heptosyltransferase